MFAYTFNGTTFTQVGNSVNVGDNVYGPGHTLVMGTIQGDGRYLYVAAQSAGFRVYDFDGTNFNLKGSVNTSGSATDIGTDGTYIYVADRAAGLKVYSATCVP